MGTPTKILFANAMVVWALLYSVWEKTSAIRLAIGNATMKPARSGRLLESQEQKLITMLAITVLKMNKVILNGPGYSYFGNSATFNN